MIRGLGSGTEGRSIVLRLDDQVSVREVAEERKQRDQRTGQETQEQIILITIAEGTKEGIVDETSVVSLVPKEKTNKHHAMVQEVIFGRPKRLPPGKVVTVQRI